MSWHLASLSCMTTDVSGPIRKFKRPSGEIRPADEQETHTEVFCKSSIQQSSHQWISLLFELEEQGSYLSIRALIWSCRRRGNSSSLSRESLCFSLRNLVKLSFVMVGLLELEGTVKRNNHISAARNAAPAYHGPLPATWARAQVANAQIWAHTGWAWGRHNIIYSRSFLLCATKLEYVKKRGSGFITKISWAF